MSEHCFAKCRSYAVIYRHFMLDVVMLNVVMLNVVTLSVVVPYKGLWYFSLLMKKFYRIGPLFLSNFLGSQFCETNWAYTITLFTVVINYVPQ